MAPTIQTGNLGNNGGNLKTDQGFVILPGVIQDMEEKNPTKCHVEGQVPTWLAGDILRNGPGKFSSGKDTYTHWFDGYSCLHKFSIKPDGSIVFQSKFLDTEVLRDNTKHNRIIHGGMGRKSVIDPCYSVFKKFFSQFYYRPKTDNTNVNITILGDNAYAITDTAVYHAFDSETLDTEKCTHLQDTQPQIPVTSAHPHYDFNGDYINIGNSMGKENTYVLMKVPKEKFSLPNPIKHQKVMASVPATEYMKPSYHHSFSLTENYLIVHEGSMKMDLIKMLLPFQHKKNFSNMFTVQDDFEMKFHVVNKYTGEVLTTRYCTNPRICFHTINAYEEVHDGKTYIVLDMCTTDNPMAMFDLASFSYFLQDIKTGEDQRTYPQRFILPVDVTGAALGENLVKIPFSRAQASLRDDGFIFLTPHSLIDDGIWSYMHGGLDLPRIHPDLNGKKYKYAYFAGAKYLVASLLVKTNVETGDFKVWVKEGHYPSEPVFVPNPNGEDEDDGVVLSTVLSSNPDDHPFLLILNAKTFEEIARAEIDAKLCLPLHAQFVPSSSKLSSF